jgi:hypothetical protein
MQKGVIEMGDLLLKINQWARHSFLLEFVFGSGWWDQRIAASPTLTVNWPSATRLRHTGARCCNLTVQRTRPEAQMDVIDNKQLNI